MYTDLESCRICGNRHLERVLDLGKFNGSWSLSRAD